MSVVSLYPFPTLWVFHQQLFDLPQTPHIINMPSTHHLHSHYTQLLSHLLFFWRTSTAKLCFIMYKCESISKFLKFLKYVHWWKKMHQIYEKKEEIIKSLKLRFYRQVDVYGTRRKTVILVCKFLLQIRILFAPCTLLLVHRCVALKIFKFIF